MNNKNNFNFKLKALFQVSDIQAVINTSFVGKNEQELLGKHLIFESFESSGLNHSSLQGLIQIPGFSQASPFTYFVDQNLDLLIVFVYREFIFFPRKYKSFRNIHLEEYCKKVLFKDFAKFTGKHLSWSLFLIKFAKRFVKTLLKSESSSVVFE